MMFDLSRHVPPGINVKAEQRLLSWGAGWALLFSMVFWLQYRDAYRNLFWYDGPQRMLLPDAVMPDFIILFSGSLFGFAVLAVLILGLMVSHYKYHRRGSKSIYLMRRLPNRWELHRRCCTVPLLALAACALACLLMLCVYYGIYMAVTPNECLAPEQWQKIWRGIL